jgi:hypothetical protein
MAEEVKEKKVEEEKPKGVFAKIKEKLVPDQDEQQAIISTFVRLGILVWSGGILTLNYVTIPGFPQGKIDPTFIASVFTGVLATFGVQTAKSKNGNGNGNGAPAVGITKKDMEMLIEKASQTGPTQTIKIEQAPIKITADNSKDQPKYPL